MVPVPVFDVGIVAVTNVGDLGTDLDVPDQNRNFQAWH
jgi:hypothetical protein